MLMIRGNLATSEPDDCVMSAKQAQCHHRRPNLTPAYQPEKIAQEAKSSYTAL